MPSATDANEKVIVENAWLLNALFWQTSGEWELCSFVHLLPLTRTSRPAWTLDGCKYLIIVQTTSYQLQATSSLLDIAGFRHALNKHKHIALAREAGV